MKKTYLITYSVVLLSLLTLLPITQYANAQLLPISVVPLSPTDLTANLVTPLQIALSWTAPSGPISILLAGYKIERSTDGGNTWSVIVANTGNTSTTYTDTGLASGTTYTYRVSAINPVGTSSPSNTASATTSSISMIAGFQSCCHGELKMGGSINNPVSGDNNQVNVQFYAPDGQLVLNNTRLLCSSCIGFGGSVDISRDQGKGNYTIVATYDNELVAKIQVPSLINNDPVIIFANVVENSDGSVFMDGRVANDITGEQVSISILDPNNSTTVTSTRITNSIGDFSFGIDATDAVQVFPTSGNYTIVATHILSGVTAQTTLSYTR